MAITACQSEDVPDEAVDVEQNPLPGILLETRVLPTILPARRLSSTVRCNIAFA